MAKILITLLGTGNKAKGDNTNNNYELADYIIDDKTYEKRAFISSAIAEHYSVDKIYTIGTKDSMWDNLCTYYGTSDEYAIKVLEHKEKKLLEEDNLKELSSTIDKKLQNSGSKCFIVENSETTDEIWQLFEKMLHILDEVDDKDELYFDITHLFRSVAVFSMIIAEFAQITRDIKISGMFYGLFKKDKPSAVVDLSLYFEFLAWTRAIKSLKDYGNASELLKLLENSKQDKEIVNSFKSFAYSLSISDMGELQNSIEILKGKIDKFVLSNNPIVRLISKDLLEFINRFGKIKKDELAKFQFELTKWYSQNNNHAMAYITLAEASVTAVCEANNLDVASMEDRKKAQNILFEYKNWNNGYSKELQKIGDTYSKINNIRNNIAHKLSGNSKRSKSTPANSIENLPNYINTLVSLLKK